MPALTPFQLFFHDVEDEFAATRRILSAFPDEHADWQPHDRSMSLATLAAHIAELPRLAHLIATEDEWDVTAGGGYTPSGARTRSAILDLFEESSNPALEAIRSLTPEDLARPWAMRGGEVVYFEGPRGPLLRQYLVSHTAHHRGQLGVCYRLLGVALPGIYGPTADQVPS